MIDKNVMLTSVKALCAAFSLNRTEQQIKDYCSVVYKVLESEGVTDKEFGDAMMYFMKTTEATSFKSLPSPADFLKLMNKTPRSIEQIAEEQYLNVVSTLNTARFNTWVMYDHPVTNYTVQKLYGSPRRIYWRYFDTTNPSKENDAFLKKNFIDNWMNNYSSKKEQFIPVKDTTNAITTPKEPALLVGDKGRCEENKVLAIEEQKRIDAANDFMGNIFKVEYKEDKDQDEMIKLLKENK